MGALKYFLLFCLLMGPASTIAKKKSDKDKGASAKTAGESEPKWPNHKRTKVRFVPYFKPSSCKQGTIMKTTAF